MSLAKGLIKVPTDLLKSLCNHIASQYISYLAISENLKSHADLLALRYGISIDDLFEPFNKDIELHTSLDDIPERIKGAWRLEFGYLRLIIDWEQKIWVDRPKVNASYEESDNKGIPGYFTVNPHHWIETIKQNHSIEDLIDILNKVQYSAWHEISHAVQHNGLKWLDPRQVEKSREIRDNPESSSGECRQEYLSSQVEFDPQIKTKIFQFQQKYGQDKEKIHQNLSAFVGASIQEGVESDEFFMVLKETNRNKWKKAIRIIYRNYDFDIASLLELRTNG
jgi:hypothetical protein